MAHGQDSPRYLERMNDGDRPRNNVSCDEQPAHRQENRLTWRLGIDNNEPHDHRLQESTSISQRQDCVQHGARPKEVKPSQGLQKGGTKPSQRLTRCDHVIHHCNRPQRQNTYNSAQRGQEIVSTTMDQQQYYDDAMRQYELDTVQSQDDPEMSTAGYYDDNIIERLAVDMTTTTDVVDREAHMEDGRISLSERRQRQLSSTKIFTGPDYRGVIVQDSSNVNLSIDGISTGIMDTGTLSLLTEETRDVFVETAIYRRVEETLKTHGYVTISGASGEGKTSMALMLGDKYRCHGYELVFVDNIDKFTLTVSKTGKLFIIFDDIFGSVGLNTDVSQLKTVLQALQLHLKRNRVPVGPRIPLQRGQRRVARTASHNFHVVFTTKSYNLQNAFSQLGGHAFDFFKGPTVLDVTRIPSYRYSGAEKERILEKHRRCHDIDDNVEVEEICKSDSSIFGFPLTCGLFFKFCCFQKNSAEFFSKPLFYLRLELNQILGLTDNKSAALILMLLCEESVNLSQLEMESNNEILEKNLKTVQCIVKSASRTEMAREARNFRGTYFTDGDRISFSHPAIYDACACALYEINPSFILKHCSIKFLYERVQPHPVQSTAIDDHLHIIYVSEQYYAIIASRLAEAIGRGQYSMSISHPILKLKAIVDALFEILQLTPVKNLALQTTFHSKDKDRFFLHWAVHAQSLYLVTKIIESSKGFTDTEINEAVAACVSCVNLKVLELLCNDFSRNIFRIVANNALTKTSEIGNFSMFKCLLSVTDDLTFSMPNGDNLLHVACEGGEKRILQHLLPSFDINSRGQNGWTPLMIAAYSGKNEIFDLLVIKGADLRLIDNYGDTVFHLACQGGNVFIVENLLPSFDINCRGQNGWTPLMIAAYSGKNEIFDLLMMKGAGLTLTDNCGNTVLHRACNGGNISIVETLLPSFDINCRGLDGWTPLMVAAYSGKSEIFDLLMMKGADLKLTDNCGNTVLLLACLEGSISIVENLLPSFDINCRGQNGSTPLMMAVYSGKKEIFDLLMMKGADLTLTDNCGNTVLHSACKGRNENIVHYLLPFFDINIRGSNKHTPLMRTVCEGSVKLFDLLLSHHADLTLVDDDGDGLLHLACEAGNLDVVKHVLPYSDVNMADKLGWSPPMLALVCGHPETFLYLVNEGADLTLVDNTGDGVLTLAQYGGCSDVMQLLVPGYMEIQNIEKWTTLMNQLVFGDFSCLEKYEPGSPELIQRDGFGDTLLHLACRGGNKQCVEHLQSCYDINVRGRYGWTPVMMAARCGHLDVFQCLLSHQADVSLVSDTGEDVLILARQSKHGDILTYLLALPEYQNKT